MWEKYKNTGFRKDLRRRIPFFGMLDVLFYFIFLTNYFFSKTIIFINYFKKLLFVDNFFQISAICILKNLILCAQGYMTKKNWKLFDS